MKTANILFIFLLLIIVILGYMVYQREKEISLLKGASAPTTASASTTTTLSGNELKVSQLLAIAEQDAIVKEFISTGNYSIYLDLLDENDFSRLPAIYNGLPRENLLQLNFTKSSKALLVILTPEKVIKVVPVTNLKIM